MAPLASDAVASSHSAALSGCALAFGLYLTCSLASRLLVQLATLLLPSLVPLLIAMALTKPTPASFDARAMLRDVAAHRRNDNAAATQRRRRGLWGRLMGVVSDAAEDSAARLLASLGETEVVDAGVCLVARTHFGAPDPNRAGAWWLGPDATDMLCVGTFNTWYCVKAPVFDTADAAAAAGPARARRGPG